MAKLSVFSGAQEILNATLNTAINAFNAFFKLSDDPGFIDPELPESKYILDEVIIPSYTNQERIDLDSPKEGEMIVNTGMNNINVFMNNRWQQVLMELYDTIYTVTVLDFTTSDPIVGALVTLDGTAVLTDADGIAEVPVVPFTSGTVPISVSKSGYTTFTGTRSNTPTSFTVTLS